MFYYFRCVVVTARKKLSLLLGNSTVCHLFLQWTKIPCNSHCLYVISAKTSTVTRRSSFVRRVFCLTSHEPCMFSTVCPVQAPGYVSHKTDMRTVKCGKMFATGFFIFFFFYVVNVMNSTHLAFSDNHDDVLESTTSSRRLI